MQNTISQHSFVGLVTELTSMKFKDARRVHTSFSAGVERRTLVWLADRMPAWLNSDHLTAVGLISMAGAGLAYWAASDLNETELRQFAGLWKPAKPA